MRLWIALWAVSLSAQDAPVTDRFTQRGYIETRVTLFPQEAPGDSSRVIGESILRWEAFYKLLPGLQISGMIEARTDSHRQDERDFRLDFRDRSMRRPAISIRRLSATYHRGKFTAEVGKQFIRWGKADILNPTDRFAPRDYLTVIDNDFLGVTATRLIYELKRDSIDAVWVPLFTPSRIPLADQRWTVIPQQASGFHIVDGGARYPGGAQFGTRWNHLGSGYEFSFCYYEGFNHQPSLDIKLASDVTVTRVYPKLRLYGADAAVPLKWFTVKGEAAWFSSSSKLTDEYVIYVVQLERQFGELSLVGGYAGQVVTNSRNPFLFFSPDRGIAETFLGRASYTIDPKRSVALETAVRQNGQGAYVKLEYSQTFGQHWRATAGFILLRGDKQDFLGQYQQNSNVLVSLRYSF